MSDTKTDPKPGAAHPEHSSVLADLLPALGGESEARKRLRRRVFEIVEVGHGNDVASKRFDKFIIGLIILNIIAFVLETVPSIKATWGRWLDVFEWFSVAVFTLEYAARIWTAVEVPFLARMNPVSARLAMAKRPYLIIDLLAILPAYLGALLPFDLRILRVLRLLRFFKLSRYSPAMHALVRVFANERKSLQGAGLLLIAALLISSTGMYYLESEAQPEKFGSVPDAAYWAMTTLTTVGYGDVTPVTGWGKVWAMLTMLMGLCVLALPVAIISTGFSQEVGRRDFVVTWSLMSSIPLLAELDGTEVAQVMPLLHAANLPPSAEILADGSPGDAMYFIAGGGVTLRAKNRTQNYDQGDFFGAVAMLDGDTNHGTFVTNKETKLLKLYREDFHHLETINPAVCAHIRRVAEQRRLRREEQEKAQSRME